MCPVEPTHHIHNYNKLQNLPSYTLVITVFYNLQHATQLYDSTLFLHNKIKLYRVPSDINDCNKFDTINKIVFSHK